MHQYKDLISLYCLYANFDKEVSRYNMYLGNLNKIKLLQYNVKKIHFSSLDIVMVNQVYLGT